MKYHFPLPLVPPFLLPFPELGMGTFCIPSLYREGSFCCSFKISEKIKVESYASLRGEVPFGPGE